MAETKFLSSDGVAFFAGQINNLVETYLSTNITNTVDNDSTNDKIPGAKAVFEAITKAVADIAGISLVPVDVLPETGVSGVVYLLKPTAPEDTTRDMYVYSGGEWVGIGTTEIDLAGYWNKSELSALTNEDIKDILDGAGA